MGFEYTLLIMAILFVLGGLLNLFLTVQVIKLDKAIMPGALFKSDPKSRNCESWIREICWRLNAFGWGDHRRLCCYVNNQ
jgi:hypothetical protein